MTERREGFFKQRRDLLIMAAVLTGFIAFSVIKLVNLTSDVSQAQRDLQSGLIRSCEQNGNPLREAVIRQIQDQIAQSRTGDLERFFPQIPPAELHRLIHQQNQIRRDELKQIQPVDCAAIYR